VQRNAEQVSRNGVQALRRAERAQQNGVPLVVLRSAAQVPRSAAQARRRLRRLDVAAPQKLQLLPGIRGNKAQAPLPGPSHVATWLSLRKQITLKFKRCVTELVPVRLNVS
jgi:hypothetical protein